MTEPVSDPYELPTEAVEAAARAMSVHWRDMHTNEALGRQRMLAEAALTAAAPLIAAQATAQVERDYMTRSRTAGEYLQEMNRLRAGIEALRDEWHKGAQGRFENGRHPGTLGSCADALDALLRGA